jgi:hypothetical protein
VTRIALLLNSLSDEADGLCESEIIARLVAMRADLRGVTKELLEEALHCMDEDQARNFTVTTHCSEPSESRPEDRIWMLDARIVVLDALAAQPGEPHVDGDGEGWCGVRGNQQLVAASSEARNSGSLVRRPCPMARSCTCQDVSHFLSHTHPNERELVCKLAEYPGLLELAISIGGYGRAA